MLSDMRSHSLTNCLSKRRLTNQFPHLRILKRRHVNGDVCLVILILECFHRLLLQHHHVFCDRVCRLDVFRQLDDVTSIWDAKNFQHLAVQLAHVV